MQINCGLPLQRPFVCRLQGHLGSESTQTSWKESHHHWFRWQKCPSVCLSLGVIWVHILCPDMLPLTPSTACGGCLSIGIEQPAPGLPTGWHIVGLDEARGVPSCFLLAEWSQDAEQLPVWWVLVQGSPQDSASWAGEKSTLQLLWDFLQTIGTKKLQKIICMQGMCAGKTVPTSQPPSLAPGTLRTHDHVQLIWHLLSALVTFYMPCSGCSSNIQIDIIYWLYWFSLATGKSVQDQPWEPKERDAERLCFQYCPWKALPYPFHLASYCHSTEKAPLVAPAPCYTAHAKKLYPVFVWWAHSLQFQKLFTTEWKNCG